jgi:hypothetical protein
MSRSFKVVILLVLTLFSGIPIAKAQLLQDKAVMDLVKEDVDYIYGLRISEAREVYGKIVKAYPGHPIIYLLKGLITYWENYPMLSTSPAHTSFEADMKECIRISETKEKSGHEAEYLLANLCARGMLISFYDDNGLVMDVTRLTMSTYKYLRRAFDYNSTCTDLYYFTGTYNYYREAYPKFYPVYRSLAFLFPHGNMETGLKQLKSSSDSSVVLRPESTFLLTWIYLSFENNYSESLNYARKLFDKYPGNAIYFETMIRDQLLLKNYNEAEKLLNAAPKFDNKFFVGELIILKGILQEKKYSDNKLAAQFYNEGISDLSSFGKYGNEYTAYAYFGLSRTSDNTGDRHSHKSYRKKALKLADFKKIDFD